jgi:hypothetical protein
MLVPISPVDTVSLAFQHTKKQLVQPFRFGQWTRLAVVGLLAGEMSGGGSFKPGGFHSPQPGSSRHLMDPNFGSIDPIVIAALIAVLVVAALVFGVILLYVSSVMRFILFDSIVAKECYIRRGWSRRQGPGWKYFLWQIGYMLVTFALAVILLGVPAALAFGMGWFTHPQEHIPGLVVGGIAFFLVAVAFFVTVAVVHVLTKDFVVPQMALEGIGAIEGWRRLWPMIEAEFGGYAAYVGMKIVLAIVAGVLIGIASVIMFVILAIPTVALAIIAAITGKSAGLTWDVYTITVAVVVGCILLAIFLYLVALISVPAIVFFPAYSIYFFAARYRPLGLVVYPPPPAAPAAAGAPPPLTPEPAG